MLKITRLQGEGVWVGNYHLLVKSLDDAFAEISIRSPNKPRKPLRLYTKSSSPFYLSDDIFFQIELGWNRGRQINFGIEAPKEIHILRDELLTKDDPRFSML